MALIRLYTEVLGGLRKGHSGDIGSSEELSWTALHEPFPEKLGSSFSHVAFKQ